MHRAVTSDGQDLAIKVQYPGMRASIDSDVDSMAVLMRLPGLLPRGMDIGPMLDEARRQLHAEADYLAEAQNLTRFGAMLQGSDAFALPHLYADLCTLQVLAMTYVESTPLDSLVDAPQQLRDRVATALIDLVLRGLFVFGAMQADPNLANYRYAPATGRFVLLDLGAVQVITPALASDFRALARAALGDDARVTCNAMLRIGYFAGDTAPHYRELIQAMFEAALAQLRQAHAYDFGNSDQLDRLRDMGLAIGHSRALAHVPPAATLFLHRKIGGMYLMAAKRRAQVALRPLVQAYCGTSTPSD